MNDIETSAEWTRIMNELNEHTGFVISAYAKNKTATSWGGMYNDRFYVVAELADGSWKIITVPDGDVTRTIDGVIMSEMIEACQAYTA